jgi:hypothetical protein
MGVILKGAPAFVKQKASARCLNFLRYHSSYACGFFLRRNPPSERMEVLFLENAFN